MKAVIPTIALAVLVLLGGAAYLKPQAPVQAAPNDTKNADAPATPETPAAASAVDLGRIVATEGALTEIVYALGFGDHVVGADSTAQWPAAVTKKPSIGYVRQLSAEGILSLSPSLLITSADAGPPNVLEQLRSSKLKILDIPGEKMNRSFPAVLKRITAVADGLGASAKGRRLADDVEADLEAVRKAVAGRKPLKTLFLFNVTQDKITAGGKGTGADEFLKLAGLENVTAHLEGWKPISQEALVAAAPEILISCVTASHQQQYKTVDELLSVHGLNQTPAAKSRRVLFVDSPRFLAGGPRVGQMALEFARLVHPDLELPRSRSDAWFKKFEAKVP